MVQISISNIVFVADNPKPGKDHLLAIFRVEIDNAIVLDQFRYYQAETNDYVAVPAIKTRHGIVRPVSVTPEVRREIYNAFIRAWEALPIPPVAS